MSRVWDGRRQAGHQQEFSRADMAASVADGCRFCRPRFRQRPPEWAVECDHNAWLGADTAPRVGARFRGRNRKGLFRWWTTATVTESTWYRGGFVVRRVLAPIFTGTANRAVRTAANQRNIERTLAQLKTAAEARR
jgi:hypothetical protein